jgi:magnesium transporter
MLIAICHSKASGWREVDDLATVSDLRSHDDNLVWAEVDVADLSSEDIATIAEEFDLHPLAVEDAMHARQRPKIETYENHLFVVLHQLDEQEGQLEPVQIACFVGDHYVLTLHAGADRTLDAAKKRWEDKGTALPHESSYLLHTIIDVVVDDYQEIADRLEVEMEELEELVLGEVKIPIQHQLYSIKQRVARLRRYVIPGSRVLEWTADDDESNDPILSLETIPLFRDVYDHLVRIADQVHSVDELAKAVLDLTHIQQSQQLNEHNRRLAAWAAIFGVGTLVGGIYGMNFALVPETGSRLGFWFALALITVLSLSLYGYFKKRKWL